MRKPAGKRFFQKTIRINKVTNVMPVQLPYYILTLLIPNPNTSDFVLISTFIVCTHCHLFLQMPTYYSCGSCTRQCKILTGFDFFFIVDPITDVPPSPSPLPTSTQPPLHHSLGFTTLLSVHGLYICVLWLLSATFIQSSLSEDEAIPMHEFLHSRARPLTFLCDPFLFSTQGRVVKFIKKKKKRKTNK